MKIDFTIRSSCKSCVSVSIDIIIIMHVVECEAVSILSCHKIKPKSEDVNLKFQFPFSSTLFFYLRCIVTGASFISTLQNETADFCVWNQR